MLSLHVFVFNPFQENTYVLSNEKKEAIIIDPGMYFPQEKEKLKSFILDKGLTPIKVLLTHAHLDHIFGLDFICKNYDLIPQLHNNEEVILENGEETGKKYELTFSNYKGPMQFINEKDSIIVGDDKLDILFAPGHSPGSIGFHSASQNFLIGGDVLFENGIGRTDLPFGNQEQLLQSIKNVYFTLPNTTKVFSGHGNPTTIGHEKMHNPFLS